MKTRGIYSNDKEIEKYVKIVDELFTVNHKKVCSSCEQRNLDTCLDRFDCKYSIERHVTLLDMYTTSVLNMPIYSNHLKPEMQKMNTNAQIIDDIYYLMKIPILGQLNSLPVPQSIAEALRLRTRPEIISFRNVFRAWCESLQQYGEEDTIRLITKDFKRASEFLEKQYYANQASASVKHALKQNLFSIIMQVPGFFIPFFHLYSTCLRHGSIERMH